MFSYEWKAKGNIGFRAHLAGLALGGAMACMLAAPAAATGFGGDGGWFGPYVGVGIGAAVMDADVKTNAARSDVTNMEFDCPANTPRPACFIPGIIELNRNPPSSVSATVFPSQQSANPSDSLADAGVMGVLTAGWDIDMGGGFLIGAVFNFDWMDVEESFTTPIQVRGGGASVRETGVTFIAPGLRSILLSSEALDLNAQLSIDGKVEQISGNPDDQQPEQGIIRQSGENEGANCRTDTRGQQ